MKHFTCQRCGWCCKNIIICVSYSDIIRWQRQNRVDILSEVSWLHNYPRMGTGGFYVLKTALNPKRACPFLLEKDGKTSCDIQITKPRACVDAPASLEKEVMEGCPSYIESSNKARKLIANSQHKDFREAFDKRMPLIAILETAREQWQQKTFT